MSTVYVCCVFIFKVVYSQIVKDRGGGESFDQIPLKEYIFQNMCQEGEGYNDNPKYLFKQQQFDNITDYITPPGTR